MPTTLSRPRILVLLRPSLYRQLFSPASDARLRGLGEVVFNEHEQEVTSEELAERIGGFDVLVTGWRSPRLTEAVCAAAEARLKLIAHSAGSVKFMLDESVLLRGITVTTAAVAMGPAVAEQTLMMIMLSLRPIHRADRGLHEGQDFRHLKLAGVGRELAGRRVGVVGAGHVGRSLMQLLLALHAQVWCYDPYLSDDRAQQLGVRRVGLDELLSGCEVVAMAAPSTPETHHMIGRRELALMPDGAVLVNTGRSWLVDQDAMLAELQTGRISAALDVFDEEPLPADHPLRKLDNVFLTPHIGASTVECYHRQGQITVDEIARFCAGQPLHHAITPQAMATMA